MTDDTELLRRYVEDGAQDAFHELVRNRFELVYAVALRQVGGDEHLARDATQRVFLVLARQAARLSRHPVLSGWLYQTARFTAIDLVRAERRRRDRELAAHTMHLLSLEAASDADSQELRAMLDEAVSRLPERDRNAVLLRVIENRSFRDIARIFQLTEDAARMRVERAFEKLRRHLRQHGVTSTAAGLSLALTNQVTASVPAGWATAVASTAISATQVTNGGAIGAIVTFMSATKTTAGIAVFSIVALGVGFHEWLDARHIMQEHTAVSAEIDRLNARESALRSRAASAARTTLTTAQKQAKGEDALRDPTADDVENLRRAYETAMQLRASNTEYQQRWLAAMRADARVRYASLWKKLGLSPAQIEQFETLLAQRSAAEFDVSGAARTLRLKPEDAALRELRAHHVAEFETALRALLGDDAYAEFERNETMTPVRNVVSQIAREVYYTDTPLTAEQADQLTQIVARHDPHLAPGDNPWQLNGIDWGKAVEEARSLLSPAQLAAWEDVVVRVRWQNEIFRQLNQHSLK